MNSGLKVRPFKSSEKLQTRLIRYESNFCFFELHSKTTVEKPAAADTAPFP